VNIVAAEASFAGQISQIKRRVVLQAICRVLLQGSSIFLAVSIVYFILNLAGVTNHRLIRAGYALALGVSFSAALVIGLARRSTFLDVLIDIDRRLGLQDRVSTAYEYFKLKKKTEFSELLVNDAAIKLHQISRQQLLPARFSVLHLLAIVLLLINIFLHSGILFTPGFQPTRRELEKIEAAGRLLKDYMIKRIGDKTAAQSAPRSEHAKKLKQISHKLRDGSPSFEQRLGALNSFLQEIEGEQARLAQELSARLDSAAIEQLPIPKAPDLANLSSSQLEKLKRLLNTMPDNRLPDSIDQNIESLQELESIETLLSRIIDDLKAGRAKTDDSVQTDRLQGQRAPHSTKTPENQTDEPDGQYPAAKFSNRNPKAGDRVDQGNFADGPRSEDNLPDGIEPPPGYSDDAGNAKSHQESQTGRELEKTQTPATQDKPASSPAKTYLIAIRALTDIGEAGVREEDILRTYRKEVESVLKKEDIPANYREYIKNYFISIGINTEDHAHEPK
jgi:hypothetical protein